MEEIDFDTSTFDIADWLRSDEAGEFQRDFEERILRSLFSDPTYFEETAVMLAWLGTDPINQPLLAKEIAQLQISPEYEVIECGFVKSVWKGACKGTSKVASFVSNHSAEILVGTAICATGVGIAYVAGYTLSASVGGVVVAGAHSIFTQEEKPNPRIPNIAPPLAKHELAIVNQSSLPELQLPSSADEFLVTTQGVWTNGQFFPTDELIQHSSFAAQFTSEYCEFANPSITDSAKFLDLGQTYSLENVYQVRGERALAFGSYDQAIQDLGLAIESDPTNPTSYLQRGAAHLALGQYDQSLEDFHSFTEQTEEAIPLSVSEFSLGFSKGLPKGVYESGEGIILFLVEFVQSPVHTSTQIVNSFAELAKLAKGDEWGVIAEALSPEIAQLAIEWDTLPSGKRGELAGYALGKHGADIFLPASLIKIAGKSAKAAKKLATVCKDLQIAQETLILEAATGVGSKVKIAEIIEGGKRTANLAEELGFNRSQMAKLKEAGKLEETVANGSRRFADNPALGKSFELFKNAQDFLKPYTKKPFPEAQVRALIHETGIPTFPRPKGIPENYLVMVADKGAGMKYIHPQNNQTYVRIMPGKPHSPFPCQQKPYVVQMRNGKTLDVSGNTIPGYEPKAHISIEEYIFRGD